MLRRALVIAVLAVAPSLAGEPATPSGTVTGQGTAQLKKLPDTLRMQIDLRAKGNTLPEALAKLKERRSKAETRLAALGAVRESVVCEETVVLVDPRNVVLPPPQPGLPGEVAPVAAPTFFIVSAALRAEWPLKAGDSTELLLRASDLQDTVRQADLGGLKDDEKKRAGAPEPEKPCHCGCKSGEPFFLFVARISDEERSRILTQAVTQARENARKLAAAAREELGEMLGLTDRPDAFPPKTPGMVPGEEPLLASTGTLVEEAVSPLPGSITIRLSVLATFQLRSVERNDR